MAESTSDGVARVIAVVGALGGFVTLVAATGGAITWMRFAQAELPADQAVAATPQTELVALGSVAIASFGLVGLAAVLLAYLIDPEGTPTGNRRALTALSLLSILVAIWLSDSSRLHRSVATVVTVLGGAAAWWIAWRLVAEKRPWDSPTKRNPIPVWWLIAIALVPILVAGSVGWLTNPWVGAMVVVTGLLCAAILGVAQATKETCGVSI